MPKPFRLTFDEESGTFTIEGLSVAKLGCVIEGLKKHKTIISKEMYEILEAQASGHKSYAEWFLPVKEKDMVE